MPTVQAQKQRRFLVVMVAVVMFVFVSAIGFLALSLSSQLHTTNSKTDRNFVLGCDNNLRLAQLLHQPPLGICVTATTAPAP